jgi:hypothetical protein
MKCAEISEALQDDSSDLRAIARHLKSCPDCAAKYGDELDWELSLRGLSEEIAPVDISEDLSRQIYSSKRNTLYLGLLRRWVWILGGILVIAAIVISIPTLISWLGTANSWLTTNLPTIESQSSLDLNKWNNELKSSEYFNYILIGIAIIIAALLNYLWHELKEII